MKFRIVCLIPVLLTLFSCESTDEQFSSQISTDLQLSFRELFPGQEISTPELHLIIKTEEIYPCANYKLNFNQSKSNGVLTIEFLSVELGDICLTAPREAVAQIAIGEGITKLVLLRDEEVNEYSVQLSEEAVAVTPITTTFSSFDFEVYHTFPVNSFAYMCGSLVEDSMICDQFKQYLTSNMELTEFSFPSNGKIPYPDSTSGHWYNATSTFFSYDKESDLDTARKLMVDYYIENIKGTDGISLYILGWNNAYYRNEEAYN